MGVLSSRRSSTSSTRNASRSLASRFVSGSSIKNSRGRRTIARPIATRCISPPGEPRGLAIQIARDAEQIGRPGDAALDLRFGDVAAGGAQRELEVPPHRPARVEREVLEHQGDVARGRVERGDVPAGDGDRAGVGLFETRDGTQERGLPGAGRPEHDEELVAARLEVDPRNASVAPSRLRTPRRFRNGAGAVARCRCCRRAASRSSKIPRSQPRLRRAVEESKFARVEVEPNLGPERVGAAASARMTIRPHAASTWTFRALPRYSSVTTRPRIGHPRPGARARSGCRASPGPDDTRAVPSSGTLEANLARLGHEQRPATGARHLAAE